MPWIDRPAIFDSLRNSIERFPVTVLLGPRQCGKTSLARKLLEHKKGEFYDLEDPACPIQPETARFLLADRRGLIVIDEFQSQPTLFALLRVLADRCPLKARFLILGSASPTLVKGASESLAGRACFIDMEGFSLEEVGPSHAKSAWRRGGFPRSFLARSETESLEWREQFVRAFLERDIPQLGIRIPAPTIRRFWVMLTHLHGQIWNAADLARSMGVKEDTARHYLDILTGSFMIRQLQPWFENVGKRLVKSPKVYFRDSGVLHALQGIGTHEQLMTHPRMGASWEGFALQEIIRTLGAERDSYFYRTHGGAELDLLIRANGKCWGFEMKCGDSPTITKSMRVVMQDLALERLFIVYPGDRRFPLDEMIEAVPLASLPDLRKESAIRTSKKPPGKAKSTNR